VLGDLVSVMLPLAVPAPLNDPLPLVQDVESGFYIHLEMADRPGALAAVAQILGEQGASIKSVVQHGLGEHARLVMVVHPLAESRLREALKRIGALDFLRSTPRAIRVIEEEFM
jgi:homoserine dehydrogenase